MREIKFRAWDENEMHTINSAMWDEDTQKMGCLFEHSIEKYGSKIRVLNLSNEAIVMQFTGLKDKNGKEIYEGDIIRRGKTLFGEIFWDNENSLYRFRDKTGSWTLSSYKKYEVIGNIYENPDLIKD